MNKRSAIPARLINVLYVDLESAGFGRQDILAVIGSLVHVWGDDIARWQEIEAAARQVLATGQARYEAEELHTGDVVPTAVMQALRVAVEESATGLPVSGAEDALPPRRECPDCESPTGVRGMCDRHFDALVDLLRRA